MFSAKSIVVFLTKGPDALRGLLWPHRVVRTRVTVSGIQVLWDCTTFRSSFAKLKGTLMVALLVCIEQRHLATIVELQELQPKSDFGDNPYAHDAACEGGDFFPSR